MWVSELHLGGLPPSGVDAPDGNLRQKREEAPSIEGASCSRGWGTDRWGAIRPPAGVRRSRETGEPAPLGRRYPAQCYTTADSGVKHRFAFADQICPAYLRVPGAG